MKTEFDTNKQDGIVIVGAANGEDDYILWQRSEKKPNHMHFEFRGQLNSGYNIIEECAIDNDGCHMALKNGKLIHFYWHPPRHPGLEQFISDLKHIYSENSQIIDDSR